jgi:hypothetical protein
VVINNQLLACKAIGEQHYLYVKPTLRVGPYFHVLAIFKSFKTISYYPINQAGVANK